MAEPLGRPELHEGGSGAVGPRDRVRQAPDREVHVADRWGELRTLLVGPERDRLDKVEEKLDDPALGVDQVSAALPEAVARRSASDDALATALGPVLGDAIKTAVRRDPQPLANAIFPIIGPAIRRSIAAAFSELVQSLNTTLEQSFTPRGLAWRFEALKSGRSFGEVVLSHSLLYRVEQLFLIHKESGLLVRHLTAPGVQSLSPEMVAGMLSAITDFARDSFRVSRQEGLDSFALGDLSVWMEEGPAVMLAAVIRGQPPAAFRADLQRAVEGVQQAHAADLEEFGRTGESFAIKPELLESCLVAKVSERAAPPRWRLWAMGAVLLLTAGYCAAPRVIAGRRFDRYVAALRNEPGVVIGNVGRVGGRFEMSGLRDPLARDPRTILADHGLDTSRVRAHWEPYVALRPEFIAQRAARVLGVPSTVTLTMRGDTLHATGLAASEWVRRASNLALAVPGVNAVNFDEVADSALTDLRRRADALAALEIRFASAQVVPLPESRRTLDSLAAALRTLAADATTQGVSVRVEVRGSADTLGTDRTNDILRAARAQTVRRWLVGRGLAPSLLVTSTDSSREDRAARVRVVLQPQP